ncbi:tRNA-specific adenosine deaminase subunit Tad3p [[Candida] railenensis]|uniref:tRNA-specific adenosine deaminase subunit Tad3p n=1 Tax=[Candida] railenensis TaxID=45579 RepID=A0A9P0VXA8_9ASCO|nr:tRNA-specific adenosine deaminase subunit Tad3p [[Candida] railenensis]
MFRVCRSFLQDIQTSLKLIRRNNKQIRLEKAKSMSNDPTSPSHVDLEDGVLYGLLKQVKHKSLLQESQPELTTVWCCNIEPKQTKSLLVFIRSFLIPFDNLPLSHVKRFNKKELTTPEGTSTVLQAILCSKEYLDTKEELQNLFHEHTYDNNSDLSEISIYETQIPVRPPPTKELAVEWSQKYWPLSWKGNPNHQYLKSVKFNIQREKSMIGQLLKTSKENGGLPVTIIARESESTSDDHEILAIGTDNRKQHPLQHSTMQAIAKVADSELKRRNNLAENENSNYIQQGKEENNYLCHNLLVYSTHEPCVMCAMALVHSRIGRIIYMKNMQNGSLESNYQLGDMDGLNWKFDIWRWIGEEDLKILAELDAVPSEQEI